MSFEWLHAQQPAIIYIGDPMCSWCYGFAPEITKVKNSLPDFEFKLIVGGLRPGGTETMADLGDFLEHHWQEVEKRSGQPVNYGIIGDSTFVLDTEPGCRAVVAARTMNADIELEFFKAVQHAFYVKNNDMRTAQTFIDIANEFGLNIDTFAKVFESEECKRNTRADFQLSHEMGVQGFPSVVIRHGGKLYLAANGYMKAEDLLSVIDRIVNTK